MAFDTLEATNDDLRELTLSEMDDVTGAGFWGVVAVMSPPMALTACLAYGAWHYTRGANQGRRDNTEYGCRS